MWQERKDRKSGGSRTKRLDKVGLRTTRNPTADSIGRGFRMSSILQKVAPIGEARDREILKDGQIRVYRETPQGEVHAHFFFPPDSLGCLRDRPVVVFFHDGFWDSAMPTQFVPHCLHFASRGVVAVAAETRIASKNGTGPLEALEDARELIRWIRRNADELGIDPKKVVVGGAGGGAWLALLTSMPKDKEMPSGDGVECRAQALLLLGSEVGPLSA
jgi:acetyl esterase/lipase